MARTGLSLVAAPLGATLGIQVMVSLAALAVPVLAPEIAAAIGVPASHTGYYTSLLYLGALSSSMTASALLSRFGAMLLSLLCLWAAALGLAIMAGGRLAPIALGTLILGLGYGVVTPASSTMLARRTPPRVRNLVFSIKQTGVPLGAALAGVALPPLLLLVSWRGALLAVGAACVALTLMLWPLRAALDEPAPTERRAGRPLRLVLGPGPLRRLALASFAFAAMQTSLASFLVIQLVEVRRLDLVAAGGLFALSQIAGVAGRIAWGALADWLNAPRATLIGLALAMSLCAVLTGSIGPAWSVPLIGALAFIFGLTATGWNGVYLGEVTRLAPEGQAGSATGGALAVTYAGVVAGPPVFAIVLQSTASFALAYLLLAALTLLGGALIWRTPPAGPA